MGSAQEHPRPVRKILLLRSGLLMLKNARHVERTVRAQEHTWGEAFEDLAVGVAQFTLESRLLTANGQMCKIIGRPKKDLLNRHLTELFLLEGSWSECKAGLDRLIAGEIPSYSTDMKAAGVDGQVAWVNTVFSLVHDDLTNIPRSLTAVINDITLLKEAAQNLHHAEMARDDLSRRMMNAQEADRTRIARELHDDIGQSLAVLKIQMLRAGKPVSGHAEMTHASLTELAGKLEKIIHKVNSISHGLHSSALELLGLAAAVKSHCRESSEQLGIPVHCSCDEPREKLDSMIALAFLRVLQEAMHNAMKHSRATSITVRLTSSGGYVGLEVSDDGVGFDVDVAALAAGLGLISMRERIHLVGGEFEIRSSPGRGTRITARAPIVQRTVQTETNEARPLAINLTPGTERRESHNS
jgi:PAS domain S-box-containing protein